MSEDPKFGELKEVPMRDIWAHEAHKFTPWLERNIGALGNALDLDLCSTQVEAQVGDFSLDLLAKTGDGDIVAIENQFQWTDHSHLGQLLTYAAGCDAKILIWIVEEARDEHRAAVEWLNRKTGVDTHFYLVAVKIVQIDNSLPAYQFIPVVAPNQWEKEQYRKAAEITPEARKKCKQYFQLFTEELENRGFPFKLSRKFRDATQYRFFDCIVGSQWKYYHSFQDEYAYVYIYFKAKKSIATEHIKALAKRKIAINKKLRLEWDDDWCYDSVGISRKGSFDDSEATLAEIRAWAVENIIKLSEAIPPELLEEISAEVPEE